LELLICMGITALLIGLTSAGLTSARAGARRAACLSHLRSLGVSFTAYTDQHGAVPLAGCVPDVRGGRNELALALEPFLDGPVPRVDASGAVISGPPYRCPADRGAWAEYGQSYDYTLALWLLSPQWWHDAHRVPDGRFMNRTLAQMRMFPAHLAVLADHGEYHAGNPGLRGVQKNRAGPADSNALYADGHAGWAGYGRQVWRGAQP